MICKGIIKSIKNRKFSIKNMGSYGGMPSSHTVFIMAVVFGIGFEPEFGWKHPLFALAFVTGMLILFDVIRLRGAIDKLNIIVRDIAVKHPGIKEKALFPKMIAHTPLEVVTGVIFAFIYTVVFNIFFYHI